MPLSECTRTCASLARVLHAVSGTTSPCYVVGGFVRDILLGRSPRDIDILVSGDPFAAAQQVARELGASFVPLNEEHCIARVVQKVARNTQEGNPNAEDCDLVVIDFVGFAQHIEDDLGRRDFTIDAMAVPADFVAARCSAAGIAGGDIVDCIIDPQGGLHDLADGRLRACSARTFEEDPGRLLRAVRLARDLSFVIDGPTEEAILHHAHLLRTVAPERTREELLKLLALPHAADSLRHLDRLGLLVQVFPELAACRDVEQPTCHFWDVLEHSFQTVATYEFVAGQSDWRHGNDEMLEYVPRDSSYDLYLAAPVSFDASRSTLVKLSCLLHDIAKPQTKTLDDTGRARFLGHATEGAALAKAMLQRLRFSTHESAFVETLVYNHLRPAQMSTEGMPTRRAVYRFFRDTGHAGIGVLYLAMADYLACRGPLFTMFEWRRVCDLVQFTLNEHDRQESVVAPSKLIDGRDLMRAFDMQPGPSVGVLLEAIREAQAAGLISTRDEALALAGKTFEDRHFSMRIAK
jgi:poly(A) polymerase